MDIWEINVQELLKKYWASLRKNIDSFGYAAIGKAGVPSDPIPRIHWIARKDKASTEGTDPVERRWPWVDPVLLFFIWCLLTLRNSIKYAFSCKAAYARSSWDLVLDIYWMIRLGIARKVSPLLYYPYRLYQATERDCFNEYVPSWEMGILCRKISRRRKCDVGYLDNKQRFEAFCRAFKLPHPTTIFSDNVDRDNPSLPCNSLFVKPAASFGGKGCLKIDYDADESRWLFDSTRVDERRLVSRLAAHFSSQPFIIQSQLFPHKEIEDLSEGALSTVRLLSCIQPDGEVIVLRGSFRMALNHTSVDNLSQGGIASPIDLQTGVLGKAVSLTNGASFIHHPIAGAKIEQRVLPCWGEVLSVFRKAQEMAGNYTFCGWDLAITNDGPVLIECNVWPEVEVSQIPHRMGLLKDRVAVASMLHELSDGEDAYPDTERR